MRLNRFLARAGVDSRRKCDELVFAGKVRINGESVTEPGRSVTPGSDQVEVDGRRVTLPQNCEYILYYKPRGCLVTRSDPNGRSTVYERIADLRPGTVTVGRLDQDTTGALLLTDDGELTYRLLHPRYKVYKQYEVSVAGVPTLEALAELESGVELEDGLTAPARVSRLRNSESSALIGIRLHEGRKRQVRRMFEALGYRVRSLKRVEFAGLPLGRLRLDETRPLTLGEVRHLRRLTGLE
jgi:23S rRNA pseudouridine2605 synthase